VRDGTIYSDGTTILGADDKSGIAAILEVLTVLGEKAIAHPPLEVVLTVQEETGLTGISALDKTRLQSRLGMSFDTGPERGNIVVAAPSHDTVTVTVHGKAAHSGSQPEKGINALLVAAEALTEIPLGRIDEETTANFGQIEGGRARNVVPDCVTLRGEARSHNAEKLEAQTKCMAQGFIAAAERRGATVDVDVERAYNSYKLTEEEPVVARLMRACRAVGVEPNLVPSGGGSDVNVLNAHGIRVVNLSTGMSDVHSTDEHIAIDDMVTCAEIALQFVLDGTTD
jgi:tripeptide aminopeptidase